jgi:hypothetical protein
MAIIRLISMVNDKNGNGNINASLHEYQQLPVKNGTNGISSHKSFINKSGTTTSTNQQLGKARQWTQVIVNKIIPKVYEGI